MRRLRLIIVAVAAMAIGAFVGPTAVATAATSVASAFSTTKIVTVSYSADDYGVQTGDWKYANCPVGYRVTGGGYDANGYISTVYGSMANRRANGREAWTVKFGNVIAGTGATLKVQAVCTR